jgi:hypothetical protein
MKSLPRWARLAKQEKMTDGLDHVVDALGGLFGVETAIEQVNDTLREMLEMMGRRDLRSR